MIFKRLIRRLGILLLPLLLLTTACVHEPLCYDHPHRAKMHIVFDWRNAPEAEPGSMSVYLFPHDGIGAALRYEFAGHDGGTIEVPVGMYDVVCVNSDTREITYSETQTRDHFYLSTPTVGLLSELAALGLRAPAPPRAPGTEGERVTQQMEPLFRHRVDSIDCSVKDSEQLVTLYPEPVACEYTVVIENVPNLQYTAGVSAALTTLADGIHLYHGHVSSSLATVPFLLQVPKAAQTLMGSFLTFGHPRDDHSNHILTVYVILANGEKWYHEVDVSDQVHNAPDPRHVYIYVSDLPIPKPIVNGGGFHPQVDDWQNEYIDLPM